MSSNLFSFLVIMSRKLIDEGYKVHVGFLYVLLGEEEYDINDDDDDLYFSFEQSYKQLCTRVFHYMDHFPHPLFREKLVIYRCMWYWGYFTLFNLTRVLNIDDLPHLRGLREDDSNLEDFTRSLRYLISITPPRTRHSDDPFLCTRNWTNYQAQLPVLGDIFRRQCNIEQSVARLRLCVIL